MGILDKEVISKSLNHVFSSNFSILVISNLTILVVILFLKAKTTVDISIATKLIFPTFTTIWFIVFKIFEYLKFLKESEKNGKEG